MQELHSFFSSNNFAVPSIQLDGKIYRFDRNGKNNAWYVGWQLFGTKSGTPYYVAIVGDWKTGEKYEYKSQGQKLSREDQRVIKDKLQEAVKKSEEDHALKQSEAKAYAQRLWSKAKPIFKSAYFERKQIRDLHGSLTSLDPESGERIIYVPMSDIDGDMWGLQRIYEDGNKKFCFGQRIKGLFHVMGDLDSSDRLLVVEGFATGASVREATGLCVVVAFNAGNLESVSKSLRAKYQNKKILICGDDDTKTDGNPGRTKAEAAAKACQASTIFPAQGFVDFNDMAVDLGIDAVKEHILGIDLPETGFIPLGFDGSRHYFYAKRSRDIKVVSSFSSTELLQLMPIEYWEAVYTGKRGIQWDQARSEIITSSNLTGPFDPFRVRGTGVWRDGKKIVVNTGQGEIESSRYVYVATKNKMRTPHPRPLSKKESQLLVQACESLKWREEKSGILLAGWLAVARIAGALPIRPHVWLTGSSGSGKSTVMDRLIRPALGSESGRLYLQGGSTEAGIRQAVKADSLPIIFDEFETVDENSKQRTSSLIELLRQSWSATEGHVVKGSAGGEASHYAMSFAALVSSIRTALTNDADRSRFCVLELAPHGSDREHWLRTKALLSQINDEFGERLFSRQVQQIDKIIKNYELISDSLAGAVNQRFGQQWGMLLAGWYSLTSDEVITKEAADSIPEDLGLIDEKEQAKITDELECLNHIMAHRLRIYGDVGGDKRSSVDKAVITIIEDGLKPELDQLRDCGIIVDDNSIYISSNHSYLRDVVFRGQRWQHNFYQTLIRIPKAEKSDSARRFKGHVSKSVKIPLL